MSDLDTLLDPSRSAHASIQGYLYQAYLGVERWLELKEDEVLRCEGDEDLDRLLRGGSGGLSEQVKAYTGDVNIRDEVVQDTLRRFLVSHHRLRTAAEPDLRRFLFTSTATRRRQVTDDRYPVDVLAVWEEAKEDGAVRNQVVGVLREILPLEETADRPASRRFAEQVRAALAWLDGDAERWADLNRSVKWKLGEPQLTELRRKIDQALNRVRPGAPPNLRDRLLSEVLDASIAPEPRDRCRTREQLVALLDQADAKVAAWMATARGYGLVKRLQELDDLRGILVDKPQDLPDSPRPGQLLTAAYEVIPFDETGREEILDDLAGWCADGRLRLVRLIHGDGGLGKTRLLIEWCRRLAAQGWLTGFLLPVATPDELPRLLQGTLPRLVVIDYAETRLEAVRALVTRLAYLKDGPKVRLVLLARREGDWWESLKKDAATEDLLDSTQPQELPRLLPGLEERRKVFRTAAQAFAHHLSRRTENQGAVIQGAVQQRAVQQGEVQQGAVQQGEVVPPPLGGRAVGSGGGQEGGSSRRGLAQKPPTRGEDTEETRRLSPPQNSPPPDLPHSLPRPLPGGEAPPPDPDLTDEAFGRPLYLHMAALAAAQGHPVTRAADALTETLKRERRYWQDEVQDLDDALRLDLEEALPTAVTALTLLGGLDTEPKTRELAQRLLSAATPGTTKLLAKLLHRLYSAPPGSGRHLGGLEPDLLGEELVWQELRRGGVTLHAALDLADPEGSKQLLTVLTRLAQRPERAAEAAAWLKDAFEAKLDDLAEPALEVAVVQGDPVGALLAEVIQDRASLELATRIMDRCGESDLWLSVHLREVALQSTQRVYDQFREMREKRAAEAHSEESQKKLARITEWLGIRLSDLGRREEALQATQEAVELHRLLAQQRPDAFRPALAGSLDNLGIRLSDLGQHEKALQATQEGVEIRRLLAKQRPDAFRPDLARSLNNLGIRLSALGRREEALQATQEAVEIRRLLAQQRPVAFRPVLASSLNNLGKMLSDLGRREEALQATREAVDIRRLLAQQRPDAFRPVLAASLGNLSVDLSAAGQTEEALVAAEEGVRLLAPFFLRYPRAFEAWMTNNVRFYRQRCEESGREPDLELLGPIEAVLASSDPSG